MTTHISAIPEPDYLKDLGDKEYTLNPFLIQVQNMNSFAAEVSASRADMYASEIGQAPPLACAETKLIMTGMEKEYGKHTRAVKLPVNGIVYKVIHAHPPSGLGLSYTPTSVIYQDMDYSEGGTRVPRFRLAHMPIYSLDHHVLGFNYKRTALAKSLHTGIALPKGTVLAHSPSIDEHGNYRFGVNANILLGSFPEVRQDGVVIRKGFSDKLVFKGYGEMSISFGDDEVPLNLYGDDENFKIHPDIGELIRPDGVLFATRKLIPGLYPIQMSRKALRQHNRTDTRKIAKEENARVVKVEVVHSPRGGKTTIPTGMADQPKKYLEAQLRYYSELRATEMKIRKEYGSNVVFHPALHNLLVKAQSNLHELSRERQRVTFFEAGQPLSEYTIKITYSYDLIPITGHKTADLNGGKGVFVDVWDDDRMPVDKDGNVADIIMDGGSIVNRLNPSRVYEIDINASFARTRKRIIESIAKDGSPENYVNMFNWLLGAYQIISPRMAEIVKLRDPIAHIKAVLKDDIHLWIPTDNPVRMDLAVRELLTKYPKCFDKILITNDDGSKVWSEFPGTIGKQYMIILEKTGEEYSAVSSPVLQSQGVPGKLTKSDKQSSPGRPQATRITGETEGRIINSLVKPGALFELLDIANSATTHRAVCRTLLTHPTPTKIERIVDRSVTPRGNNRIVNIGNDGLFAAGFQFEYRKVEE